MGDGRQVDQRSVVTVPRPLGELGGRARHDDFCPACAESGLEEHRDADIVFDHEDARSSEDRGARRRHRGSRQRGLGSRPLHSEAGARRAAVENEIQIATGGSRDCPRVLQADPRSAFACGGPVEDPVLLSGRDAGPLVAHRDLYTGRGRFEVDRHLAVGRRPRQRVHEDVGQHLRCIAGQRHRNAGELTVDHEPDARSLCLHRERFDHVVHDRNDLLLSLLGDHLAANRPARDVSSGARTILDDRERAIDLRG
jgi:hypothetical protein